MALEQFSKLREIDSLSKMKAKLEKDLSEEKLRISSLLSKKSEKELQLSTLLKETGQTQQELFELEKKLKTSSEQKQRVLDHGGEDSKVAEYEKEIQSFEDAGFELLERLETLQQDATAARTFLSGLEKTFVEISSEVETASAKITHEIENLKLRIKLSTAELDPSFQTLLMKMMARNLAHGPFTRTENGSCYMCRYKISKIEESEVDIHHHLKNCPQCGRIFLPYGC